MSFTDKVVKALQDDDMSLKMTIEDVKKSTIQEILLYYTYTRIMEIIWRLDFSSIPHTFYNRVGLEFEENHDIMSIAYDLTRAERYFVVVVSQQTKDELLEYSKLYGILADRKIESLLHSLNINNDSLSNYRTKKIFKAHLIGNNTKSARNKK